MSDFAPPAGPPPPKVPEGWKAQWNAQYQEWFFVNIYTKKSQWDKPTAPVYPSSDDGAPAGPPPGYSGGGANSNPTDYKTNPYDTSRAPGSTNNLDEDAALAARLQAEEDARAARGSGSTSRNAQQDYQNTPMPPQTPQQYQDLPPRDTKPRGFLGKLLGKASGSSPQPQYGGYGGNQYGRPPQQAYGYGGPPPQQYGGYPPQGYGPPPGGYGGGYGGGYQQPPPRQSGGGMGAMGGAALGLGGGLIGGMLLEDAIQDHDQNEYQQGYDQGQDNGDNGNGGDYGGGDDMGGGGDF